MAICGTCNGYVTLQASGRPFPHNRLADDSGSPQAVPCEGGSPDETTTSTKGEG